MATTKWRDKRQSFGEDITGSEVVVGPFRVSIHRHIDYDKDDWLMSVYPSNERAVLCRSKKLAEAKTEAVNTLKALVDRTTSDIILLENN